MAPIYNGNMKDVHKPLRVKVRDLIKAYPNETILDDKEKKMHLVNGLYTKQ